METRYCPVKVADAKGQITYISVPVIPAQQEPEFTTLSKLSQRYRVYEQQRSHHVSDLIRLLDLGYSTGSFNAANQYASRRVLESLSLTTLNVLADEFSDSPEELVRAIETDVNNHDDLPKSFREIRIRELAVYASQFSHINGHMLKLILDTLRASHPMFAREDLTELCGAEASAFMTVFYFTMDVYEYRSPTPANSQHENVSWTGQWYATPEAVRSIPRFNTAFLDFLIENPDRAEDISKYLWLSDSEMLEVDTVALKKWLAGRASSISLKSALSDANLFLGSLKRRGYEKVR